MAPWKERRTREPKGSPAADSSQVQQEADESSPRAADPVMLTAASSLALLVGKLREFSARIPQPVRDFSRKLLPYDADDRGETNGMKTVLLVSCIFGK